MARYRSKDQVDLTWNKIRRRITRELDTEIQNAREEALNELLSKAWVDYQEALSDGHTPEVESKYTAVVATVVADIIPNAVFHEAKAREPELD